MNHVKFIVAVLILSIAFVAVSCKKDDIFVDPAYVFLKWTHALKELGYDDYSRCEAYPKTADVFRQLYSDYYYKDLVTREIGEYNENDIKRDIDGNRYTHRMVYFECKRIDRKTDKSIESMKGEVEFIRYLDEPGSSRGWLMYNRTIIRTGTND